MSLVTSGSYPSLEVEPIKLPKPKVSKPVEPEEILEVSE